MSTTYREVEYQITDVIERYPCDQDPTLHVVAQRRVVTSEHHADGSVTRHETPWRSVQSWTYKHDERETA